MSFLFVSAVLASPAALAQGQPTVTKTVTCTETRHFHGLTYVPSTRRLVVSDTENNAIYHYDMMDEVDGAGVSAAETWTHFGSGNYQGIEYHEGLDHFFCCWTAQCACWTPAEPRSTRSIPQQPAVSLTSPSRTTPSLSCPMTTACSPLT